MDLFTKRNSTDKYFNAGLIEYMNSYNNTGPYLM